MRMGDQSSALCSRQTKGEAETGLTAFGRDFCILESPCCAGVKASVKASVSVYPPE